MTTPLAVTEYDMICFALLQGKGRFLHVIGHTDVAFSEALTEWRDHC